MFLHVLNVFPYTYLCIFDKFRSSPDASLGSSVSRNLVHQVGDPEQRYCIGVM